MPNFTPLRYPGGKAKLAWLLKTLLDKNRLCDGVYVEPYAGGAGVALDLLLTGYVRKIQLNDLNPGVFAFWDTVVNEPEALCRKISRATVSIPAWKRHRKVIENYHSADRLELAFAFLFLNRTNRSGIINAGVIGGLDQSGTWKIDARFYRETLIDRIELIAEHADKIEVSNEDAVKFLRKIDRVLPQKSLIYLDPPYFVQGKRLYDNFYNPEDHQAIATLVSQLKAPWMVSYDDTPEIRAMYRSFRQSSHALRYSAQNVYQGAEVLVFSDGLMLPDSVACSRKAG